jgi:hypothetical protein
VPQRQKPPVRQKYTEDEINLAMRLSQDETRAKRLAVALGATKSPQGRIQPPSFDRNLTCCKAFAAVGIVLLLIFICSLNR